MSWTLIILIHAGMLSKGDSVALTNVEGFATKQMCDVAGEQAKSLSSNTFKETKFICVKTK
jgi:hypothetical protein